MKYKIVLSILLVIIALTSCEMPTEITDGRVYDKKFTKAHRQTDFSGYMRVGEDDYIPQYLPKFYPDKWEIAIKKMVDDEEETAWIEVDEEIYNKTQIGDYFGGEEKCD